jgi:Asp-tRNA(Asn)/Glu-tRNA(Gln) amidotransferase A subunit family amidase
MTDSSCGCACGTLRPKTQDSALVEQLKNAGAIPIAKTNVPWHLLFTEPTNPIFGNSMDPKLKNSTLGGRSGAMALLTAANRCLVGFGTDEAGGLRLPASQTSVFTLKPTSARISKLTQHGVYDSIPSTAGPMSASLDSLTFVMQALLTNDLLCQDPLVFPLSFNSKVYGDTISASKLTIGFYVDDQIIRASPSARRAVFEAAQILHEKGHNIIRFHPPSTQRGLLLLSKLFAYEKLNQKCLTAGYIQQTTVLHSILSMYTLLKIPKLLKIIVCYLVGFGMKDPLLKDLSTTFGGGSNGKARSLEELNELIQEKEDYARLFATAWQNPNLDVLICPVHACPPGMSYNSTPFTWIGSFYSSLYNLLDYPSGFVPRMTQVQQNDKIPNIVQYAHNDRYSPMSERNFNLLSVMALEECNHAIIDESILGRDIGVQVVGRPFEEEKVLAVMKLLNPDD